MAENTLALETSQTLELSLSSSKRTLSLALDLAVEPPLAAVSGLAFKAEKRKLDGITLLLGPGLLDLDLTVVDIVIVLSDALTESLLSSLRALALDPLTLLLEMLLSSSSLK